MTRGTSDDTTANRPPAYDWAAALAQGKVRLPPLGAKLGFRLSAIGGGEAVVMIDAGTDLYNTEGTLHGGVLCTIADAAMGFAYQSTLGPDTPYTTVELKINFLRPALEGTLEARARLIKSGRTVGVATCDVADGSGNLVAWASCTCLALLGRST